MLDPDAGGPPVDEDAARSLRRAAVASVEGLLENRLRPGINATGILLHTGLGRAVLAASAADAMRDAAASPTAVELDLEGGRRGRRTEHVRDLLVALTGAESATVVNNGAAALLLSLAALASGRRVVVSRGELVEIGGSFRLPEVIEAGGARLLEVGTTNRTRAADVGRALERSEAEGDPVGAILSVHASNFRIEGFTEAPDPAELSGLARHAGIPFIHDIGSGRLDPRVPEVPGLDADEPDARSAIAAGADVVLFSGDKLLGGPQAGILVGRADLIARLDRHPLHRALRVDAPTLAGLAATLRIHLDPAQAATQIPAFAAARRSIDSLRARASNVAATLSSSGESGSLTVTVEDGTAFLGGGTTPARAIPSVVVAIRGSVHGAAALATRLRTSTLPVVARVAEDAVRLDMRSVAPIDDERLVGAVLEALGGAGS